MGAVKCLGRREFLDRLIVDAIAGFQTESYKDLIAEIKGEGSVDINGKDRLSCFFSENLRYVQEALPRILAPVWIPWAQIRLLLREGQQALQTLNPVFCEACYRFLLQSRGWQSGML